MSKQGELTGRFCGGKKLNREIGFGTELRGRGDCGEPTYWHMYRTALTEYCPICECFMFDSDHPDAWRLSPEVEDELGMLEKFLKESAARTYLTFLYLRFG
jgi:hypothetical protein